MAGDSRAALEKSKPFKEPIVTEITLATAFYPAEEYHQDYYKKKNPVRYKYYRNGCGRDARLAAPCAARRPTCRSMWPAPPAANSLNSPR